MPRYSPFMLFRTQPKALLSNDQNEESGFQLLVQYQAFNKQLPLMYCILLCNTWILSCHHQESAPHWLTLYIPLLLSLVCLSRLAFWFKTRHQALTPALVQRRIRQTNLLAAPVTLAFASWAIMLFNYGDTTTRYHIAGYFALTMLCSLLCLMHIRVAAIIVTVIANVSFIILLFTSEQGQSSELLITINIVIVLSGMMLMLYFYSRDFVQLIQSHIQAETLGRENFALANLDSLTQLPNRRKFFHDLERHCADNSSLQQRFALGILDLDGFKPVNDLYGHGTGDKLLYAVSRRLENICAEHASVARMGGDEFAIIITANMDEAALLDFCTQIGKTLRSPYAINNHMVHISASIGLAIYPDMAQNAHDLYEFADYALYHGKRNTRSDVTLFSNDHRKLIVRDANIEQALRRAALEQELSVFFQPIIALSSGRIVAFEALARWHSSELGIVSPAVFIPIAEQAGLISDITLALLVKALQVARSWPEDIGLAFNLSAHDISTRRVVERIMLLLQQSGVNPQRVEFEITETAGLQDLAQIKWCSEQLRQMGCGITLDDFGTGFSSFRQLHELPLTKIKIDRCFIRDIHSNPLSRKIVQSLMTLSCDMQIQCVLEGVENADELHCIQSMGAELAQGYYFSQPVPEVMSHALLAKQAHTSSHDNTLQTSEHKLDATDLAFKQQT